MRPVRFAACCQGGRVQESRVMRNRLLFAFVLVACLASPVVAAPPPPYNIVIFKTDDQRWDTVTRVVDGRPVMPQVTALLADKGVTFTEAFVPSPVCCPERAGFLAGGYYPHHTGVRSQSWPNGGAGKFIGPDARALPVVLQNAGYKTGFFGKYMNEFRAFPFQPPGWTRFVGSLSSANWYKFEMLVDGVREQSTCAYDTCPAREACPYINDYLKDQTLDFISDHAATSPVFVMYSAQAPHGPATPACRHEGMFSTFTYRERAWCEEDISDKPAASVRPQLNLCGNARRFALLEDFIRNQLRSLQAVDDAVGQIVAAMASSRYPTVFIFTSDHGYAWGEHQLRSKGLPYEEMIRVPFIVRMPNRVPRTVTALVSPTLDLGPTIREFAGLPEDPDSDGWNLVDFLRGDRAGRWSRKLLLQLGTWAGLLVHEGPRTLKYVEYGSTREREFYVLRDGNGPVDPFELQNRVNHPAHAATISRLAAELARRRGLTIITEEVPPPAILGEPYEFKLRAWGGVPPYRWSRHESSSQPLPSGLSLVGNPDGSVSIVGRPRSLGSRKFAIVVHDSEIVPFTGLPQEYIVPLTLRVDPAPTP
jgi:arylsulfatase A-like enzyme